MTNPNMEYGGDLTTLRDGDTLFTTSGAEVRVVHNDQPFKQFNVDIVKGEAPRLIRYNDVVSVIRRSAELERTRAFTTGATRDTDNGKLDYEGFISPLVTRAYAEYMHRCRLRNVPAGQALRASDNWQKGIPQDVYAKSLIRHVQEFWLLHDGFEAFDEKGQSLSLEDVCMAIKFNIEGYVFERLKQSAQRTVTSLLSEHPSHDSAPSGSQQHSPTQ